MKSRRSILSNMNHLNFKIRFSLNFKWEFSNRISNINHLKSDQNAVTDNQKDIKCTMLGGYFVSVAVICLWVSFTIGGSPFRMIIVHHPVFQRLNCPCMGNSETKQRSELPKETHLKNEICTVSTYQHPICRTTQISMYRKFNKDALLYDIQELLLSLAHEKDYHHSPWGWIYLATFSNLVSLF